MDVGRVGIWTMQLDFQPAARARELAAEIEELGYGTLWIPEAVGREAASHAAVLLGATERLVVANGVATIWHRSPWGAAAAQRLLADASGGRFLLGLGVSHGPMVEGMLGQSYDRPLSRMRGFLDAMDEAFVVSPPPRPPAETPPRVLAALGPKMLRLAAARKHTQRYLTLPNYVNNLRRLGWGDDDLAGDGSDKLVDALVAWGDADAIAARVAEHHAAGADHVCVQVLGAEETAVPLDQWRELAPAIVGV